MWDNAPLLRSISAALFFCSVLAILYGAVHYVVHLPKLLPIRSVRLIDAPNKVAVADVQAMVRREVHGNFLTVDIDSLRQALEKLPWVRKVSIRREFPDRLAVHLEEHQALAHWNDTALVNRQGEVFYAETTEVLPRFTGVEGSSEEVTEQYAKFNKQLEALNLHLTQLVLTPRHAWKLQLSNEMVVDLGREAMQQRLARFVAVYPYSLATVTQDGAAPARESVQVVDMRYRNGFAVKKRHGSA